MKRVLLISATIAMAAVSFGQECNTDNSLFKFDNAGTPKVIWKPVAAPEFPFLKNLSSSKQVYSAVMKNAKKSTKSATNFNDLMMAIGFTNGTQDLTASDIMSTTIPAGTTGNMGMGNSTVAYAKLSAKAPGFKAWKISSGTGCYVYILKNGDAFYPQSATTTTTVTPSWMPEQNPQACITTPVALTGDQKEVTVGNSGQTETFTNSNYIYYERRRHKREVAHAIPGIASAYPSKPLLISSTKDVEVIPDSFRVTANTPQSTVTACPDVTTDIAANINVEKISSYTGYYPGNTNNKTYKMVSKRDYKIAARKMRKAERKDRKIARRTGVKVNVSA